MPQTSARSRGKLDKGYRLRARDAGKLAGHEPAPVRVTYLPCPTCNRREPCPR